MEYSRVERARLIGARALQLSFGAAPLIKDYKDKSYIEIARKELEEDVLPITVIRNV
ncbi:MAG: DNA-directed RNA polymerase subunit K [Candidatus Rehaiarchaeum fermentans]|nr:DNA-directed RNA polymerase subunit K [Candidatus Rehaiarchaeum fermentans]